MMGIRAQRMGQGQLARSSILVERSYDDNIIAQLYTKILASV